MKVFSTIFFVAFVAPYFVAHAQGLSTPPFFTVTDTIGCAPFTVTINAPSCNPCAILHDKGDDPSKAKPINGIDATPDTLIYSQPGTYTMLIVSGSLNYTRKIIVKPNYSPSFDAYACSGNSVYLKVTDSHFTAPNSYIVDYPSGQTKTEFSNVSDVLTTIPTGKQAIKVRGKYYGAADNCLINSQIVTVQLNIFVPSPTIDQLTVLTASQVKLDVSTQPGVLRKLEIAVNSSTSFQQLQNIYNVSTVTLSSGIKPDDNFYCFRMAAVDYCTNTTGAYSFTICSINFDAVAKNNQNNLTWSTSPSGVTDFTLTRNSPATLSPNPSATDVSRIDNNIVCATNYTYQLTANYFVAKSISLAKTVTSISADVPPVIDDITAAVHATGTGVDLSWSTGTKPKIYSITRTPSSVIGTSTSPKFVDDAYTNATNYCYKIKYNDNCNNPSSESLETCPVHLAGFVQKDNVIILNWSAYSGWKNGVASYTVEKYTTTGQLIQSYNVGTATTFTDDVQDLTTQAYIYIVNANANDIGLGTATSNAITLIKQPNLFYPAAFTPNSDNLNDKFSVFGQFIAAFEMEIFNRWGELLFSTNSLSEGWDGTFKGIPMPEGTYAFTARITDSLGKTSKKSGSIILLRKK